MTQTPFWDKVFSTASWGLVLLLLFSALSIFTFAQPGPGGPLASASSVLIAKSFYATMYTVQAALLAFAKWKKRKSMRKHVLMFIYLTGFFTTILAVGIYGWDIRLLDNVLVTLIAAGCWLYWKFKTEYITYETFEADIDGLRHDSPPSRRFRFKE